MRVWRIARATYPLLDGEGARLYGGRWNSPGLAVVYAAAAPSLAVLELLVWADPEDVPGDLRLYEVSLPDDAPREAVTASDLPPDWQEPGHAACAAAGDAWLRAAKSLVLAVPSAILPEETNYLLNPRHPGMSGVRVADSRPFHFDLRLPR